MIVHHCFLGQKIQASLLQHQKEYPHMVLSEKFVGQVEPSIRLRLNEWVSTPRYDEFRIMAQKIIEKFDKY